ncbi:MAG: hypothetical protein KatS3mg024_0900 [Armatimonadota bacterium]|nr:MAG: hypothetical protein KatS3mg024_0900 [Armatimonadota bacterium]
MREYECLYILHPGLSEEDVTAMSERFCQVVRDNGGEVLCVNPWGKRRLAYEIAHCKEGIYIQMRLNGDSRATGELDQALRFSEHALRHLIVRADELDPAATNEIPEQLPEPTLDDYDARRGRSPRPEAVEEAEEVVAEGEESAEVAADEAAGEEGEATAEAGEPAEETAPEPAAAEPATEVAEEEQA